jgi:oxygen-independent coproporphyrinogen-3 oxidase
MIPYSFKQPTKSLYIHWPFCTSKCHFCDFISFEQHENFYNLYHKALCNEITTFAHDRPQNASHVIETIFLGGGTPSLYPKHLLQSLFTLLHNYFTIVPQAEITLEANPADVTEENLAHWKSLGINRLSLGVQILNNDILFKLNRRQRIADTQRAIKYAPHFFSNISIDLILGLPDISETCWFETLAEVISWPITHVSLYFLTVHKKTPLFFKLDHRELFTWPEERFITNYEKSVVFLIENGFLQYEISNFSRPGFESAHNKIYWNRLPYRGFGIAASSFDGFSRFSNEKNLGKYLSATISNKNRAFMLSETLTNDQIAMEILMLGLRQRKGVNLRDVLYFLKDEQQQQFYQNVAMLKEQAFLEEHEGVIQLTIKGMVLENEVILRLL